MQNWYNEMASFRRHMARNKWVMVEKASALSNDEWKSYITKSYQIISSKLTGKVKKELGLVV